MRICLQATLRGLCEDLNIPFQASMLKWEAGPKSVDGIWAPWWYKSVHKSTGFAPPRKYPLPFPSSLYDLLEQSLPFYNMLRHHAWRTCYFIKSPCPKLPISANEKLFVWVGNDIVPRESAKVSVFDSIVQGGDAVWEGLRVYSGKIFKLEEHLDRFFDSAKALAFSNIPTREEVKEAIFKTLIMNGMFDNAHIRLTLTRGKKPPLLGLALTSAAQLTYYWTDNTVKPSLDSDTTLYDTTMPSDGSFTINYELHVFPLITSVAIFFYNPPLDDTAALDTAADRLRFLESSSNDAYPVTNYISYHRLS
ncbi:Branched-chain-amino-acid aminotransferase-like protein 2 [Abeliophyllum distichum]|uniref:Branched-chain-amino-acid aminotransferase-like protein 2 n=1 Tax=Abeliophyllum distichum TaxID=126358 RepID=A0ABD1RTS2_9LAMI